MRRAIVTGAGGFIGSHLTRYLKSLGYWVRGVDLDYPQWRKSEADEFVIADLRDYDETEEAMYGAYEVFHLAADMGGMGFITTRQADIISNNTRIDINVIDSARKCGEKLFFSSSVCIYPTNLLNTTHPKPLREEDAYPALAQESYGWVKLHMEHLCKYYREAGWLDTRVARFDAVYGTETDWQSERAKAPAAIARKVALAKLRGESSIEIWGDGQATRNFMHVSDCVRGIVAIMQSRQAEPVTLGTSDMISVDDLARMMMDAAGVSLDIVHVPGPQGVRGRAFCHDRIEALGWKPEMPLRDGMTELYNWVEKQVQCAG